MKKTIFMLTLLLLASCAGTKKNEVKNLYEVIWQESYGGSRLEFYEIFTEPNEFKMFLKNPELKSKVNAKDIETSNFVILNHGERSSGGYSIGVDKARETNDSIFIKIKKTAPSLGDNVTNAFTQPVCIIKINSKKPIAFE